MTRDTTTGSTYEHIIAACIAASCARHGISAAPQVVVGVKPGGGNHKIDWELTDKRDSNRRALVSCKVQNVGGTAEEKTAYEVIKLLHAMDMDPRYKHAFLVLGGDGWSQGMKLFVVHDLPRFVPAMAGRITVYPSTDILITNGVFIP